MEKFKISNWNSCDRNKEKRQLDSIDWEFTKKAKGLTSSFHWYPGTFPSQLPSSVIQALSSFNDIVFDPYGGSGTTSAEALRLGRKAWIADINPIGVLSSYVHGALIIIKRTNPNLLSLFFDKIFSSFSLSFSDCVLTSK